MKNLCLDLYGRRNRRTILHRVGSSVSVFLAVWFWKDTDAAQWYWAYAIAGIAISWFAYAFGDRKLYSKPLILSEHRIKPFTEN